MECIHPYGRPDDATLTATVISRAGGRQECLLTAKERGNDVPPSAFRGLGAREPELGTGVTDHLAQCRLVGPSSDAWEEERRGKRIPDSGDIWDIRWRRRRLNDTADALQQSVVRSLLTTLVASVCAYGILAAAPPSSALASEQASSSLGNRQLQQPADAGTLVRIDAADVILVIAGGRMLLPVRFTAERLGLALLGTISPAR